ncbi:DNA-binding response OmpR family regulator [Agrobacterium larrymoorei]|uniref:DNA-binding response OmpR family regulator n=1 Tax=Agrobacterium larrymoorei TaxID=160699 RepID=A0AAJ2B5W9_9HYPH|nr:response regulator [Agrobacterium larrymoorei]MDR6099885.1 DNA-binding response OmpR family regulator [Agrobacterium larrymoorei]
MRVLIVEDDPSLARGIVSALVAAGYAVDSVGNGRDGLAAALEEDYSIVVLDLGLPEMDGLTVLKALRQAGSSTPVMILTARDAIPDRVAGLDVGADDYLTKPFALEEFEARVRSLVRRGQNQPSPILTCGALSVDRNSSTVKLGGHTLFLRPREYSVLVLLLSRAGQVVQKERLASAISNFDDALTPNAVELHLGRLRKKLEPNGPNIRTIRGVGYILEVE